LAGGQTHPTGKEPHHLYLAPDEKSLIIANALSDSLPFVDPRTAEVQRTVRGILDPYQLRFSPDMQWFVTAGEPPQPRRHLPLGRQGACAGRTHPHRQDAQSCLDRQQKQHGLRHHAGQR